MIPETVENIPLQRWGINSKNEIKTSRLKFSITKSKSYKIRNPETEHLSAYIDLDGYSLIPFSFYDNKDFFQMLFKTYPIIENDGVRMVITNTERLVGRGVRTSSCFQIRGGDKPIYFSYRQQLNTSFTHKIENSYLIIPNTMSDEKFNDLIYELVEETKNYQLEMDRLRTKKSDVLQRVILPEKLKDDMVSDISDFINKRNVYDELGLTWKRGYILEGPAGNGKTLFLRSVAEHFGLQAVDLSDFIDMDGDLAIAKTDPDGDSLYNGISIDYLTRRENYNIKPTLYYLEDMEKVVAYQSEGQDFAKITLSSFLKALDGFQEVHDGFLLMATTNYMDRLSKAVGARPGRFDRIFTFQSPTKKEIEKFFNFHKFKVENKETTSYFIEQLDGMSMAFVEDFVKSCKIKTESNKVQSGIAESVLGILKSHHKFYNKEKSLGFNS